MDRRNSDRPNNIPRVPDGSTYPFGQGDDGSAWLPVQTSNFSRASTGLNQPSIVPQNDPFHDTWTNLSNSSQHAHNQTSMPYMGLPDITYGGTTLSDSTSTAGLESQLPHCACDTLGQACCVRHWQNSFGSMPGTMTKAQPSPTTLTTRSRQMPDSFEHDVFTPTQPIRPKKRPANVISTGDDESGRRFVANKRSLSASHCIGASAEQETTLQHFLARWETREHLPNDKEVRGLAQIIGLSPLKVALWLGDRLRIVSSGKSGKDAESPPPLDPEVMLDIVQYCQKARTRHCASAHSRKAAGGKYRCTFSCGYSTNQRNAWERHEEKKQPQRFWHCISCRVKRTKGQKHDCFLTHRFDKFPEHAKVCSKDDSQELRRRSEVPYNAPFDKQCIYCNHVFTTWRERNDHYIKHFDDEADHEDHSDDFSSHDSSDDEDEDDDDDEDGNGGGNHRFVQDSSTAGNRTSSHIPAPDSWTSSSNTHGDGNHDGFSGYNHSASYECANIAELPAVRTEQNDLGKATCPIRGITNVYGSSDTASPWLIDIKSNRVAPFKSGLRFLALKYSAPQKPRPECLQSPLTLSCPRLPNSSRLPPIFQKSVDIAKDLGFEYLWIDIFCGLNEGKGGAEAVYKQAALMLVVGHPSQYTSQVWHFTCDYSHLNTVQSWAKQSVSFHHLKQLGHGAYSVVDQVQLQPTLETYARKIVFRGNLKRALKARHVQEIEIMQKFNHPHIAHFVAAYYDNAAFNILISPVAECDLRVFLAAPDQFPEQRKYLPIWFMSLAEALAQLHRANCRHKDIKPANILISNNTVLLADFGTSLDFSTTVSTSNGGALMTPKYCAPEVAAKDCRGRKADVFSLGCVFAEMITIDRGKSLDDMHAHLQMEQESNDSRATYHHHLAGLTEWLGVLSRGKPNAQQKRVLRTCLSMIAKDPKDRPDASDITKEFCSKANCTGLHPDATCHCCPRGTSLVHSDARREDTFADDLLSRGAVDLLSPEQQRSYLAYTLFKDRLREITDGIMKYCTYQLSLDLEIQAQYNRFGRGSPFRQWVWLRPFIKLGVLEFIISHPGAPGHSLQCWSLQASMAQSARCRGATRRRWGSESSAKTRGVGHVLRLTYGQRATMRPRAWSESDVRIIQKVFRV